MRRFLSEWQRLARSDAQLPFDEILPGDHFRDGMFDLQASVHLDEIELPALIHELNGAGADVIHRARSSDRGFADANAQLHPATQAQAPLQ